MCSFKKMRSSNCSTALIVVGFALLVILLLLTWSDNPFSAQAQKTRQKTWLKVGTGGCSGHDVGNTNGFIPDEKLAQAGYTAICFDGRIYDNKNERGRVFCTYKNIASDKCTGGGNKGVMYRAVVR